MKRESVTWDHAGGTAHSASCTLQHGSDAFLLASAEKYRDARRQRCPCSQLQCSVQQESFSGVIQDPPGHGPVQPALGDPASAGGLD